jgi:hydrocephalus-inducing protein
MGESGPPIPDPVEYSIIKYPEDRTVVTDEHKFQYFNFIAYGVDDPNVSEEDRLADAEATKIDDEHEKRETKTIKAKKRGKSAKKGEKAKPDTPPEEQQEKILHLKKFRWIVEPNEEAKIRVRFVSDKLGIIEQKLKFEILGNQKQYEICCKGVCAYPTISTDPSVLFAKTRKTAPKKEEVVSKRYVIPQDLYHFGPLLVGKSRDKIKVNKHPENKGDFHNLDHTYYFKDT